MNKPKPRKDVVQTFRTTIEQQKILRYLAMQSKMSIGEYIRKSLPLNNPNHEK